MKFKGSIIITDPCYVTKGDDWERCDYGDSMYDLGFTTVISESTIYGDWGCTTYATEKDPREIVDKLGELQKQYDQEYEALGGYGKISNEDSEALHDKFYNLRDELISNVKPIGKFCADAGMVCVLYLDEVLKYNPDFEEEYMGKSWVVTVIKDFDGEVEYVVDKNTEAHIIGTGNINFFTVQTSL